MHQNNKVAHISGSKEIFSTKKSCKINTNAPKMLNYGTITSLKSTHDDPWSPQIIFFSKMWMWGSPNFDYRIKISGKWHTGMKSLPKSKLLVIEGSKKGSIKMIPREFSWWSMMSPDNFFPKCRCGGLQILITRQKWCFGK